MRCVVAWLLLVGASVSLAQTCPTGQTSSVVYTISWYGAQGSGSSPAALCQLAVDIIKGQNPQATVAADPQPNGDGSVSWSCNITQQVPGYNASHYDIGLSVATTCTPPPPPTCPNPSDPNVHATVGNYVFHGTGPILRACGSDGCEVQSAGSYRGGLAGSVYTTVWSSSVPTGNSCTPDSSAGSTPDPGPMPLPQPVPDPPPPGQCDGTVNGVAVRVTCTQADSSTPTKSSSSGAGSSGGPTPADAGGTPTPPAPGDSQAGTQSTSCSGGSCTTTTTTTTTHSDGSSDTTKTTTTVNASAGTGTSTTVTSGKQADGTDKTGQSASSDGTAADTCKAHPSATGCNPTVDSASFGDCVAPPSCTGDAVSCAIAAEVHKDRCAQQKLFDDLNGQSYTDLGTAVLAGSDPQGSKLPTKENGDHVNVASSLDQSGFIGGAQCFSDRTFTGPFGMTFAVSFSSLCAVMLPMRYGIMLVAGLVSLGIIGRATTA